MTVLHPAPKISTLTNIRETLSQAMGDHLLEAREEHGEFLFSVKREAIDDVLRMLRDEHGYQQLMEIAGVDYPSRAERFEVVYMLLSVTKNHRVIVKVQTDAETPVPTVTNLWPNAGWLEREVFDLFGVLFSGNTDLRRILTDYGFEGHPFRKDFPLTGYSELRYSEDEKRVVYEPVELAQELRTFDFLSPWEGADYVLPGDEKAEMPPVADPKVTDSPKDTGAGPKTDEKAANKVSEGSPAEKDAGEDRTPPPAPTEDRPARAKRKGKTTDTKAATTPRKTVEPNKANVAPADDAGASGDKAE
ncbi:NADH-quinone oxidoreductase subunit C [Altererythrobacter aurantiacus]|uniref:NADH-quinone oxidoreductase subunit C n=1 Tax=Parapontixanthobacter aurantiacus TaxID=1463599 RepID=A0A844Z9Z3_9SPHN|nr:NADH-quinone oxidoreductase subunit C [Parapontixanthobacter aurantiacus]MXO85401.1 NADH-quinone oxidoreductase subunit C [Parapontixanthobacter aurantiacus]